jgi:hypothetical protein
LIDVGGQPGGKSTCLRNQKLDRQIVRALLCLGMRDGSAIRAPGELLHLQLETLHKAQAAEEGDNGHGLVAVWASQ